MPSAPWELRGGADLRRISAQLRTTGDGKVITAQMRTGLRAAASPLVPAVRASIMQIPSKQARTRRTGLRAALRRAVTLRVRTVGRTASVAIMVDGRKMPPREGALPGYMEGTRPRWRHPVYGNPDVFVTQPAHPYFYRVVRPLGITSRAAVNRVLNTITREIT